MQFSRSEVEKLSHAFSRWVEHSDWSFICLQISCLKWENYHVDFNHSVSERFAWIGSPTPTRNLPIFLLLHVLLLTEGMSTALKFLVRNPHTRIGTRKANGHPRVSLWWLIGKNICFSIDWPTLTLFQKITALGVYVYTGQKRFLLNSNYYSITLKWLVWPVKSKRVREKL